MIVYFVRHGIAEEVTAHGSDAERQLTEKGRAKMAVIGKALAGLAIEPQAILTSPLVRARQTAEIVAKALGGQAEDDERLAAGFDLRRLGEMLRERPGAESLMLVGHEPNMSAVIGHAIGDGHVEMKKGAVACVEFLDTTSLRGKLLWLAPPKILGG